MKNAVIPSKRHKYCLAAIVFWIVPLSGMNMDIYTPSLPAVAAYFHTTPAAAQLTITAYLLGLGIMQLVAGGISDSFGRKKPFMFAMFVYILTTFLIPYVPSIDTLILL